jgi:hypothetical protein
MTPLGGVKQHVISGHRPDMTDFGRTPVLPEATLVGAFSGHSRRPSLPQRPLHVDSGRLLCANTGRSPMARQTGQVGPIADLPL